MAVTYLMQLLLMQLVADFGTLLGTYDKGFAVIIEPWDGRLPSVPDPVIQLACLDASIGMKPVFDKFQVRPCSHASASCTPATPSKKALVVYVIFCLRTESAIHGRKYIRMSSSRNLVCSCIVVFCAFMN